MEESVIANSEKAEFWWRVTLITSYVALFLTFIGIIIIGK
jgi:hypothetical protein